MWEAGAPLPHLNRSGGFSDNDSPPPSAGRGEKALTITGWHEPRSLDRDQIGCVVLLVDVRHRRDYRGALGFAAGVEHHLERGWGGLEVRDLENDHIPPLDASGNRSTLTAGGDNNGVEFHGNDGAGGGARDAAGRRGDYFVKGAWGRGGESTDSRGDDLCRYAGA